MHFKKNKKQKNQKKKKTKNKQTNKRREEFLSRPRFPGYRQK